jgi:deoxyadenosine/deoxycytidine kinase
MSEKSENNKITYNIGISGIIGAGKSTLVKDLGKEMKINTFLEPVETNPYLESFYKDMLQYSFPMQIFLLNKRFKQHQKMIWSQESCIQDRTIYEDSIFAKMLWKDKLISDLDYRTYRDLYKNLTNFLNKLDFIVFLDVSPQEAMKRVKIRSRDCESDITLDYLTKLHEGYKEWLSEIKSTIPVLVLDWNEFHDIKNVVGTINNFIVSNLPN